MDWSKCMDSIVKRKNDGESKNELCPQEHTKTCIVPTRFTIGVMAFLACTVSIMLRSNMTLNMLAMGQPKSDFLSNNTINQPNYGPRYLLTEPQRNALLRASYYGSALSMLPCGLLLDRFGCVSIAVFFAFLIATVLEMLTPFAVNSSFATLLVFRFIIGILHGGLYPAIHKLLTKWSPPNEIGKFASTMVVSSVGTLLTWSLMGVIIEAYGWEYSNYITALVALVFTWAWLILVHDSPATHPRISDNERTYIEQCLPHHVNHSNKRWPPIMSFATSVPAMCLLMLQFANLWGMYFTMTCAPKFINEVLGFKLSSTGLLASAPCILRCLSALFFGVIGDSVRSQNVMEIINIRRMFCVFSHIVPGLLLLLLPFIGHSSPYACVLVMALCFGLSGAAVQSVVPNYHDLSPHNAASLFSLCHTIGTLSEFLAPLVVIAFTTTVESTIEEWHRVFMFGAAVYILPALVFIVYGSASVQPSHTHTVRVQEISPQVVYEKFDNNHVTRS